MIEDGKIDENIIDETLDSLLKMHSISPSLFFKTYKSLPINLFCEIERLSMSRSTLYKDRCTKASTVADYFHKSVK